MGNICGKKPDQPDKEEQMLLAATNRQWGTLSQLLKNNNINVNVTVTYDNHYKGCSALMIAADNGRYDIAKLLISKGAEINITASDGEYKGITPLLFALKFAKWRDDWNVANLLIANDADFNMLMLDDNTPILMLAIHKDQRTTVELLIAKGADVNQTFSYLGCCQDCHFKDFSALLFAACWDRWSIVSALLENGAVIAHIATKGKAVAINALLHSKNLKLLKFLLTQGVTLNLNDPDWANALNKVDNDDPKAAECAAYVTRMHDKRSLMTLLHYNMFIGSRKNITKQPISMLTQDMTIKLCEMLTEADPKKYTSLKI